MLDGGVLDRVNISNIVQAAGAGAVGCAIAGLPGHAIENVILESLHLTFAGGGKRADARREIPENADKYPEHNMFGTLPAYGFYCRHVKGLSLRNIQTSFLQDDERPALDCDDVDCRAPGPIQTWMEVSGDRSERITVMGNDLGNAGKAVDVAGDVAKDAVFLSGNRCGAAC